MKDTKPYSYMSSFSDQSSTPKYPRNLMFHKSPDNTHRELERSLAEISSKKRLSYFEDIAPYEGPDILRTIKVKLIHNHRDPHIKKLAPEPVFIRWIHHVMQCHQHRVFARCIQDYIQAMKGRIRKSFPS